MSEPTTIFQTDVSARENQRRLTVYRTQDGRLYVDIRGNDAQIGIGLSAAETEAFLAAVGSPRQSPAPPEEPTP